MKTETFPEVASPPHVRGNFSQINLGITRADVLAQNKPENEFVQFVQKDLEVSDWTTPRGLVCTVTSPHTLANQRAWGVPDPAVAGGVSSTSSGTQ